MTNTPVFHVFATPHTHTDTTILRLAWILSGTTQVGRHQKGKTNLDLLEQETVSGTGISWAICKSAPWPIHITTQASHHSLFYRSDALPAAQPTASKHWRQSPLTSKLKPPKVWKQTAFIQQVWQCSTSLLPIISSAAPTCYWRHCHIIFPVWTQSNNMAKHSGLRDFLESRIQLMLRQKMLQPNF